MTAPNDEAPAGGAAGAPGNGKDKHPDSAPPPRAMTSSERAELGKLLRLRGKVAQNDLKARGAEQVALIEQQLSARYRAGDAAWAEIAAAADAAVKAADAQIADRCRALGIPASFRPGLNLYWYDRGENAEGKRRTELRMLARAEIEARVKRACSEVDRAVASLSTRLIAGAIQSADGRAFLDSLPEIDALLPAPSLEAIENISASPAARRALGC